MASTRSSFIAAALLLSLAACGGGAGGGDPVACGDGNVGTGEGCDDGNRASGDGCEADCTLPAVPVQTCEALAPLASGTCEVTAGGTTLLLQGNVLVPGEVLRGGFVGVEADGTIGCVGCDCSGWAGAAGATRIACPAGVISPGLVNAHDHLSYAQNGPFAATSERYEHRLDWLDGLRAHTQLTFSSSASADQVRWGELRHLMGGATSTVGGGGQAGFLRNLDQAALLEGLTHSIPRLQTFPVGRTLLASGCGYTYAAGISAPELASLDAALLHAGEGIDAEARNELLCLSGADPAHDVAIAQVAFVNAIALRPLDLADLAVNGTALVWSPRSNVALYGDTAPVATAARLGVQIALGTDWMPTGSSNMLRELACADAWNRERLDGHFTDEQLWLMATTGAADAAGALDLLGVLAPGKVADVAVFDGRTHTAHRAVLDAAAQDVVLVLRGGKVLYGDGALVAAAAPADTCDAIDVCGTEKRLCATSEVGASYAALAAANAGAPPAFACGVPAGEPTCVPRRPDSVNGSTVYTGARTAGDDDGDGIPDGSDLCPAVFDPIRPLDGGAQQDSDGDGAGDACDPCPLVAGSTGCTAPDPYDTDGDGTANALDNCPSISNDQADADTDFKGDACDACPLSPNPGAAGCPATIYEVKDGTWPVDAAVALSQALVTGRAASGFFLQAKPGDAGYAGADRSGIWVDAPGNAVAAGDRVSVTATVADLFGQLILSGATVSVDASLGEAAPAPVVVTPAEVATGGARAAALEGVIVEVDGVSVTALAAGNEFVVAGSLRVDDLLYLATPFPVIGANYASLTGILAFRSGDSKLEPRSAADVVAGAPVIVGFGPATSFVYVGDASSPTFPTPLTVTLSNPPAADTFVSIAAGEASLTVVGGGVTVPAGQATAQVLVDGVAQSPGVTLTATLGGSLQATVRVLSPAESPVVASLAPGSAEVAANGTLTLTVALDIPAPPGGTLVALSTIGGIGTLPASVLVPAGQLSATFDLLAAAGTASGMVTATLGASSASSTITVL